MTCSIRKCRGGTAGERDRELHGRTCASAAGGDPDRAGRDREDGPVGADAGAGVQPRLPGAGRPRRGHLRQRAPAGQPRPWFRASLAGLDPGGSGRGGQNPTGCQVRPASVVRSRRIGSRPRCPPRPSPPSGSGRTGSSGSPRRWYRGLLSRSRPSRRWPAVEEVRAWRDAGDGDHLATVRRHGDPAGGVADDRRPPGQALGPAAVDRAQHLLAGMEHAHRVGAEEHDVRARAAAMPDSP